MCAVTDRCHQDMVEKKNLLNVPVDYHILGLVLQL